jgi:hypothetical protein
MNEENETLVRMEVEECKQGDIPDYVLLVHAMPKKGSAKRRRVMDMRALNENVLITKFKFKGYGDMATIMNPGDYMFVMMKNTEGEVLIACRALNMDIKIVSFVTCTVVHK